MPTTTQKRVINFVTGNAGKVKSIQEHIGPFGFEVKQTKLSLVESQADTAEAIALSKAEQAFKILKEPVIVEDSSFHIDELHGFPGPYIKYTLQTLGIKGLLKLAEPLKDRTCRFTSVLAYIDSDGVPRTFIDTGDAGILAKEIDTTPCEEAWSDLWRVFIPAGANKPLSALSGKEREAIWDKWKASSAFTQFSESVKKFESIH